MLQPSSRPGLRYGAAALALGVIALWGSENLFWTAPQEPLKLVEWVATWAAYSLVAAAALSVVLWAGIGGWRAAFLGGATLGFGIEGVIVGTMYDAFPAQVIWTPLAWHGVVTGLLVFALPRHLARGPVAVQVIGLLALGLFGATWGLYWPTERHVMPDYAVALFYLVGLALPVVAAQIGLDRLQSLTPPTPILLWAAPVVLLALWLLRAVLTRSVVVLACPAMILTTAWILRRLGRSGAPVAMGPAVPLWRHGMFLLVPLTVATLVVPGWQAFGPVAVNVPVALVTGVVGLGLWLWLLWQAARAPR